MNEIKTKTKQKKVTRHSNSPRVLFDLVHKQCNGIIKGWLHCLTSELKVRFLVNNTLLACLVIAQIQFSLIKQIRTGRPAHSLQSPFMQSIVSIVSNIC